MKCRICNRSMFDFNISLHRVNPKGEIGIWECNECIKTNVDPEVKEITGLLVDFYADKKNADLGF